MHTSRSPHGRFAKAIELEGFFSQNFRSVKTSWHVLSDLEKMVHIVYQRTQTFMWFLDVYRCLRWISNPFCNFFIRLVPCQDVRPLAQTWAKLCLEVWISGEFGLLKRSADSQLNSPRWVVYEFYFLLKIGSGILPFHLLVSGTYPGPSILWLWDARGAFQGFVGIW